MDHTGYLITQEDVPKCQDYGYFTDVRKIITLLIDCSILCITLVYKFGI